MANASLKPALVDPVSLFVNAAERERSHTPIPLVSTTFDVTVASGLAVVKTCRLFRNREDRNIEAILTFPKAVEAVLFGLEARIEGSAFKAMARKRELARADYEDAIERGKTAVLHEELPLARCTGSRPYRIPMISSVGGRLPRSTSPSKA